MSVECSNDDGNKLEMTLGAKINKVLDVILEEDDIEVVKERSNGTLDDKNCDISIVGGNEICLR
jgi:hypothetical protein